MDQMKIIEELKNNKDFIANLSSVESNEEAVSLFASKGIEITCADIQSIKDGNISTELNEDLLDNVVGGYATVIAGVAVICLLAGFAKGLGSCK